MSDDVIPAALLRRDECPICQNSWSAMEHVAAQLKYAQAKAEKALRDLDDARAQAEADYIACADALHYAREFGRELPKPSSYVVSIIDGRRAALNAQRAAEAELTELRRLAETAMRGATVEERQMAASVLVARLVRPPDATRAAADALSGCVAAANGDAE